MSREIKGKTLSFEEIAVIEKKTGGLIKTHENWCVKGVDGCFSSITKPQHTQDIVH